LGKLAAKYLPLAGNIFGKWKGKEKFHIGNKMQFNRW
jgi:hypothetical protein